MAQSEMLLSCCCGCNFPKFVQTLTDQQVKIRCKKEGRREERKGERGGEGREWEGRRERGKERERKKGGREGNEERGEEGERREGRERKEKEKEFYGETADQQT